MMTVLHSWESELLRKALIGAPSIQHDESVASWIQHVCASHQYSISRLESILLVKPRFHDWDLRVGSSELQQVLAWTDFSFDDFSAVLASVKNYSASISSQKFKELLRGPPVYRWCPDCLAQDERPYLRWWWRLPARWHCPKHQRTLVNKCSMCSSELVLSYALMVNAGKRFPVNDLSICQGCGFPRVIADPHDEPLRSGSADHPDPLNPSLKKERPKKVHWGKDKFLSTSLCTAVMPPRNSKRPALLINANVFKSDVETSLTLKRVKWSLRFRKQLYPARDKLAYALRLIRKEVRSPVGEDDRND